VIMDTMCSVLPIDAISGHSETSEVTIGCLNWKSGVKNPSCLYIVSTPNGTSSVVLEGNFQKIYFNKNGLKKPFVFDPNDDKQCIKIIQVPLRQKSRKQIEQEQEAQNSSWGISNIWWSASTEQKKRIFDVLPTNCKDKKVQSLLKKYGFHQMEESEINNKPKISRSGMKVVPSTVPLYCCTRRLVRGQAESCYGEKNANITVSCDGCGGSYSGEDVIWHCPETINELHPNGYDLCNECASKQIAFDELRGLNPSTLQRDQRYPIRVTLMYYKTTTNGTIDTVMTSDIIQKMAKAEKLGRSQTLNIIQNIQSIQHIKQPNITNIPNINIPKTNINPMDYKMIIAALQELKLNGEYVKVFQSQNVTDSDLLLLNENDLNILFAHSLGARIRFRSWLKANTLRLKAKQNQNNKPLDMNQYRTINNIFRSLPNIANQQQFISNFVNHGINDKMIPFLNEEDLKTLIPEMSIRVLFRAHLAKKQQAQVSPVQIQQTQPQQFLF